MKVNTRRFTKEELACNCCGYCNVEDRHVINLDTLADAYGPALYSNSTCRCKEHNKNSYSVFFIEVGFLWHVNALRFGV